ncbi:MAG TPA: pilus assembly protein TadG-related protein [Bryobacteraceae bacterium]|nr:pilus assembly protein TadG-related protein [Bryobacteraceae bacterium]
MQILVLLVPVFFGLMGFAVDLGRMYLIRGELRTAAEGMALASASRLIGTDASTVDAGSASRLLVETGSGYGNKYDFGSLTIGESNGFLNSEIAEPSYWGTAGEAIGDGNVTSGNSEVGGSLAKHVRIELMGEAPLIFWRFLSLGQEGKVAVRVRSAAGVSAPLCTACGTEPIAIAPLDATDTTNFGFTTNQRYTFGYSCTGNPIPQPIAGAAPRLPYVILNRSNDQLTVLADDSQQLYRAGAQGLIPSTTQARACFSVNTTESVWANATALPCNANVVQTTVTAYLCGLASRMDNSQAQGCTNIPDVDTLTTLYQPDTDLTDLDDYAGYTGNTRRILTVAIVDLIDATATGAMTVLGFRQFLLAPVANTAGIAPNDANGRYVALYLGSVMPLKQGRMGDCQISSGPGKVVLHR